MPHSVYRHSERSEESGPFREACYDREDSILHGVYLERAIEMLRCAQHDKGAGQPVEVSLPHV